MTKEWNKRNEQFDHSSRNSGDDLQGHNRSMRAFRLTHPANTDRRYQQVAMVSNDSNRQLAPDGGKRGDYFPEHNETMQRFHESHPTDLQIKAALLETMPTYNVTRIMPETGGSTDPTGTTDWSAFIPAKKVLPHRFSQN